MAKHNDSMACLFGELGALPLLLSARERHGPTVDHALDAALRALSSIDANRHELCKLTLRPWVERLQELRSQYDAMEISLPALRLDLSACVGGFVPLLSSDDARHCFVHDFGGLEQVC